MEGVSMRIQLALFIALLMGALFSPPRSAQSAEPDPIPIILVVGAGGTEEYAETFQVSAEKWDAVGENSGANVLSIGREDDSKISDREQLQAAIKGIPTNASTPCWLVMIGHGTFTRGVAKFNLRGLDVSAAELAEWLKPMQRPLVIVNCASSSGPFVNRLSGAKRVIVTATKSGNEQNYARFGQYFATAIASPDSDLDHDDEVSVQEAFLRASGDVRLFYESEDRIATEHALLDDNGDGKGTPATMFRGTRAIAKAKAGAKLDGSNAARFTLTPQGNRLPFTEAELKERAEIESELDLLRSQKANLEQDEYDAKLEPLMLRLAKIYQAAESRQEQ